MTSRIAATIGAVLGALAVILGAFGAHALRSRLDPGDLSIFETAVRYQMYHAFAMFAAAWMINRGGSYGVAAAWSFIAGTVVFSGSLYLLVATGQRWFGAITPIGGVALILGWLFLASTAYRLPG